MPFLETHDLRIHYEFAPRPAADVLLFSNSLGTNLSMWSPQVEALGERFSILRYDSRGHGATSLTSYPYTIEQLSRDVLALLDGLGLDQVHFCGLSLGGMVGQWLGAHAADRLKRLVLCNTAAQLGSEATWNERIATVQRDGIAAIVPGVLERWYTPEFRRDFPAEVARTHSMLMATDAAGYMASSAAVRDMDQRESVRQIRLPVLVIYGARDPVTTAEHANYLHQSIAGSQLLALQAAHLSNTEAAAPFNQGLLDFLCD